ncbi:hypothetical protein SAMN05192534_11244 [Alteribacillus persepolensis]|uniref:Uncharacterized protein n=1 Tax=Alteribacillus persepolensis TaxID=568899 RepID=A0A1G8FI70_9BACI|nr:hypothetical protein [Alteribacillus persepolensis]SDH81756.1 hypothetical protein SAMN05192534_11244 [Alteribacillus persepolensis]
MFKNNKDRNSQSSLPPYTVNDLLNGSNLDVIAAVLLLTGRLKVESVQVYRGYPIIQVTLLGEYKRVSPKEKADKMADFLKENDDITIDDVMEAIKNHLGKEG